MPATPELIDQVMQSQITDFARNFTKRYASKGSGLKNLVYKFKFRLNEPCHTDKKACSLQDKRTIKLRGSRSRDIGVRKSSHTAVRFELRRKENGHLPDRLS